MTDRMTWSGHKKADPMDEGPPSAEEVVAWVNGLGGQARLLAVGERDEVEHLASGRDYPVIVIRTPDGWVYACPGDTVIDTGETFDVFKTRGSHGYVEAHSVREFRIERSDG